MTIKYSDEKPFTESTIVLPNSSGSGVQLGTYDDKGSAAFGWRDITSEVSVRGVVASDPTFTQVGSTAFRFYRFAINKFLWFNFHIPHDIYIPPSGNATIHFHTHWFVDGSASPTSGSVTWQWTYAFAKGFNQEAFDFSLANSPQTTAKVITATQATGIPFQHMVAETVAVTIPGLSEPDGIICAQLARVSNGTSPLNELSSNPFMITADIHYQSTNIATKQKSPNFYAA